MIFLLVLVCVTALPSSLRPLQSSLIQTELKGNPVQPHKTGGTANKVQDFNSLLACAKRGQYLEAITAFTEAQAKATKGQALVAPLKQAERGGEKVANYFSKDWTVKGGGVKDLSDIIRASIIYDDYSTLAAAIPKLKVAASDNGYVATVADSAEGDKSKVKEKAAKRFRFFFCRVKNRFNEEFKLKQGEYHDFLTNICVTLDNSDDYASIRAECGFYHVAEMQLHVKPIIAAKEGGAKWLDGTATAWADSTWKTILGKLEQDGKTPITKDKAEGHSWEAGHYYYEKSRATTVAEDIEAAKGDADKLYLAAQDILLAYKTQMKKENNPLAVKALATIKAFTADDLEHAGLIAKFEDATTK